jgi:GNAT superfamily N-acetyltransferase
MPTTSANIAPVEDIRPVVTSTRRARPEDLPELGSMIAALAAHHGDQTETSLEQLQADLFGPTPWISAFVTEYAGELVGYAILVPLYRAQEGKRGMDLHHLYVKPEFRAQGIGRLLVEKAKTHARVSGCAYMSVGAATGNFKAHRFYEQMDFVARPVTGMRYTQVLA